MRKLIPLVAALAVMSCKDDSHDNLVDFTFQGESYSWGSNNGSCQFRNQSSIMYCFVDVGIHPDEDDLSFSVGVDISEQLGEGTYEDVRETATPNVDIGLWIEDADRELRYFEAPVSSSDTQTLTITRLESSSVRGTFEGVLECSETSQVDTVNGEFFMVLTQ